ncbi:DegT/DnrJ/EryC1/StrS family aminotransferase, partial [Enterococcus cecorum]
ENTSAIIPVHVYGNICDVYGIKKLADKYKLKVIYDGAHSFGEKFNGINVSNFGDATIYSFHASKVFNTIEGGCVATQNKNLKEKIDKLTNFGLNQNNSELIGMNAKMNEFSAAMGLCNLRNFETTINKRKYIIERYKRGLDNITS